MDLAIKKRLEILLSNLHVRTILLSAKSIMSYIYWPHLVFMDKKESKVRSKILVLFSKESKVRSNILVLFSSKLVEFQFDGRVVLRFSDF